MRAHHFLCVLIIVYVAYAVFLRNLTHPSLSYCILYTSPIVDSRGNTQVTWEDKTSGTRPVIMTTYLKQNGYAHQRDGRKASLIMFRYIVDYIEWYPYLLRHASPSHVYALLGIDLMANKANMYKIMRRRMRSSVLVRSFPETYVLHDNADLKRFVSRIREQEGLYILKKNLQRQQGCVIIHNEQEAQQYLRNDPKFVVAQRLLTNNLLIHGRKCNIRRYVIIVRTDKYVKAYLHNNGFIYYSSHTRSEAPTIKQFHITTGYINRKIYDTNPMTVYDMYDTIGSDSRILEKNMLELLSNVFRIFVSEISESDPVIKGRTCFAIMGCDLSVNEKYECMLMEINKGPDLNPKDDLDGTVKRNIVESALTAARLINGNLQEVALIATFVD